MNDEIVPAGSFSLPPAPAGGIRVAQHQISKMSRQVVQYQFTTRVLRSLEDLSTVSGEWEECRKNAARPWIGQHPQAFLVSAAQSDAKSFRAIVLYLNGKMIGTAPLVIRKPWRWKWNLSQLGLRRSIAQFNLKLADFCGPDFGGNLDNAAAHQLQKSMFDNCEDCDAIRVDQLRSDSYLGRSLLKEPSSRRGWWLWQRKQDEARWLVRIEGTIENYLKKFSSKTRQNFKREHRLLAEHFCGQLQVSRISDRRQLGPFIQAAQQISAQSWQNKQHAPDHQTVLAASAEQGWLRSYLLTGNGQPLAYVIGRQSDGVFCADDSAFDTRLGSLSPGKVLWLKVIEDLHAQGGVRWMDFGSGNVGYKEFWAHESYPESSVLLIKPNFRNALAFWPMMAIQWPVTAGRKLAWVFGRSELYDRSLHWVSKMFRRKRRK